MIACEDVVREFRPPGEPPVSVLRGIDLRVEAGETVAIVGPSGSGKSTLLNLLGGLDRPDRGRVVLDGQDLGTLSENELALLRNRRIGLVFQLHHLLPQCTVRENVLVPTLARRDRPDRAALDKRAENLLKRMGLGHRLDAFPATLSGGERQRVAVARALINQPGLVLADEPTGALDEDSARELADLLLEIHRTEGVTLIVVTHSREVAARMGRCLRLRHGKLATSATPSEAGP